MYVLFYYAFLILILSFIIENTIYKIKQELKEIYPDFSIDIDIDIDI